MTGVPRRARQPAHADGEQARGSRDMLAGMNSTEIITNIVLVARPWLVFQMPLTVEQVYVNAREILAGSTGGSMIS